MLLKSALWAVFSQTHNQYTSYTDNFCGCPQLLQAYKETVPQPGHDYFILNPFPYVKLQFYVILYQDTDNDIK
jgi:hypothetical protein